VVTTPVQRGQVFRLLSQEPPGAAPDVMANRPVLVVSRDELNRGSSVLAVPFTSQQLDKRASLPWCVTFLRGEAGLDKDCVAKCDQISVIDKTALDFRRGAIGRATTEKMQAVVKAVRYSIRDDSVT
jgi:mRNA-degrading endonuclease toxin of MazEF toxin-antitoxin module